MIIAGIKKLSLLDYPEKLAATIFTCGCNFRCPFCHNAQLVTGGSECEAISEDEVLRFLESRVGKLDGVCITGGEPLLQNGLSDFIRKIRSLGFFVKLDTNGFFPDKLSELLENSLLDYIAMDIKNSEEKYAKTVALRGFDIEPVKKSIQLILSSKIPFEFRTTLVRGLHTDRDMYGIGELIKGAPVHYLQNFENSGDLVGFDSSEKELEMSFFSRAEIEQFQRILSEFVQKVEIRG